MRRKQVQNIRDIIKEIIQDDNRLESGLLETRVVRILSFCIWKPPMRLVTKEMLR